MVTFIGTLDRDLLRRLHARRPGLSALLRRGVPVRVLDDACWCWPTTSCALRLLGRRRPVQLPADRLLVRQAGRGRRGPQGVPRHPPRRLRLVPRHLPAVGQLSAITARLRQRLRTSRQTTARAARTADAACLLLFCGAVGKSAQFPLHVWLPDAMEGPTPVSALIHAATMVTAGVYLVARCTPLFVAGAGRAAASSPCIGGFTALLAALIALTQNDLKRVLAYSTVSQLGYMFLALGSGVKPSAWPTFAVDGGDVPPVHARLLQGAAVPGGRQRHARDGRRHRHAPLQRPAAGAADHALDVPVRRAGPGRRCRCSPASGARTRSSTPRCEASEHPAPYRRRFTSCCSSSALFTAGLTAFYTFRAYFLTFWGDAKVPHGGRPSRPRVAAGDDRAAMSWPSARSGVGLVRRGAVDALVQRTFVGDRLRWTAAERRLPPEHEHGRTGC